MTDIKSPDISKTFLHIIKLAAALIEACTGTILRLVGDESVVSTPTHPKNAALPSARARGAGSAAGRFVNLALVIRQGNARVKGHCHNERMARDRVPRHRAPLMQRPWGASGDATQSKLAGHSAFRWQDRLQTHPRDGAGCVWTQIPLLQPLRPYTPQSSPNSSVAACAVRNSCCRKTCGALALLSFRSQATEQTVSASDAETNFDLHMLPPFLPLGVARLDGRQILEIHATTTR